jgi:hypothetical protein
MEGAYLSRLIFMFCKQFRMFRGFQEMRKVHQALSRYLNMEIVNTIQNFYGFLPDPEDFRKIRVPYRENIEYILLKLQGLSKLLLRIILCCKKSAAYFLGMVWNAGFLLKGTVFIANLAKIWDMSRELCKIVTSSYDKIFHYKDLVKSRGGNFLPEDYRLPGKLADWLGEDYEILVLAESREIEALVELEQDENFESPEEKTVIPIAPETEELEDCGVPLNRSLVAKLQISEPCPQNQHSIESISNKKSIKKFLKDETNYRKLSPEKSITIKKLNNKKFKSIKEDIKRKAMLMQENPFIEYVKNLLLDVIE